MRVMAPGKLVLTGAYAVLEGAQGLSDAYTRFRRDGWLRISLRRTSEVDMHHAHFRYAWESLEGGRTAMTGWCFGWVDAEGFDRDPGPVGGGIDFGDGYGGGGQASGGAGDQEGAGAAGEDAGEFFCRAEHADADVL